jgi:hypothetical protein
MPVPSLQKLAMAMDGEFPILEFLYIKPPALRVASFSLPQMFEAPQLRHLWLDYFIFPIGSPCLSSAVGLVTLFLRWTHTSTYIQPELFLRAISLLLHLQQLEIGFRSDVSSREIEGQLPHTPITTQVTLPNLRQFKFWGNSGYLETLLPHMTIPLLQDLSVHFFNQLTFSVPRLLQFVIATEYPRFSHARLLFYLEGVLMNLDNPPAGTGMARLTHFQASVVRRNLFQQVLSITRILNDLRPLFSSVADLSLEYREHPVLSGLHNEVNRTLWRELLGLFMNVETLRVCKGLVGEVSHSLGLDGERPLELLPELKELVCPTGSVDDKTFAPFIHDREVAGHPVKLIGEAFPVGRESDYTFVTSIGAIYVALDPDLAVVLGLRDEGWPGPSPL